MSDLISADITVDVSGITSDDLDDVRQAVEDAVAAWKATVTVTEY